MASFLNKRIKLKHYQHALSLVFAIHETNNNPRLLNNITLGMYAYDNLFDPKTTYETILDLLSAQEKNIPNYRCDAKNVWSVIGGLTVENSLQMADILNNYKIPQFIYGSFEDTIRDKPNLPFMYWMGPRESTHQMGLVQLLLHFKWTWIGLLVSDDDKGENFARKLIPLFAQNSICLAFWQRNSASHYDLSNPSVERILKLMGTILSTDVTVIIVSMDTDLIFTVIFLLEKKIELLKSYFGKVWIMPPQWYLSISHRGELIGTNIFHGALSFSTHTYFVPEFQEFLHHFKYDSALMHFFCLFWQGAFKHCKHCREEKLDELPEIIFEIDMSGESYSIYNAVYAVSHALHGMHLTRQRAMWAKGNFDLLNIHPWQLHPFLKNIRFNNGAGQEVVFENGGFPTGYDIINWVTFPNHSFLKNKVGEISPSQTFSINEEAIEWHRTLKQVCICVAWLSTSPPFPGADMHSQTGEILLQCKEGSLTMFYCALGYLGFLSSISFTLAFLARKLPDAFNEDAALCVKCPEDQYPNENKDQCIPKTISFLSYQEPLGIVSTVSTISLSLITCFVMQTFLKNWDTPIVKANNQSLTCILLISILICYLATLLFLGKPEKVICLLQQPIFLIFFSVAVSCVLAKTIIVVLAFMSTKPASQMKKGLGKKLGSSVVVSCSLVQVCICIAWLSTSPPFPGADMHSQTGEILLQCKQGSLTMFNCALGYLGFLSSLSFTVAFLARKLPDAFNEGKFITFSMLVFCSVWISFIPAYLSTTGKNVVVVEIFAILASNTGLLACIFLPKCYVIIFRADLNSRMCLKEKRKHST
ncbi:vomeronasal type-2 receptor 26-like [Pogona vitticeps]